MTNEEMQRAMEFIVEQQAQFAANIQRLEEQRIRDTPRLTRVEESFQLLVQLAKNTASRLHSFDSHLAKHDAYLKWLNDHLAKHDAYMAKLDDHLAKHDEHLSKYDAHLAMLDDHLGRRDKH